MKGFNKVDGQLHARAEEGVEHAISEVRKLLAALEAIPADNRGEGSVVIAMGWAVKEDCVSDRQFALRSSGVIFGDRRVVPDLLTSLLDAAEQEALAMVKKGGK